MILLNSENSIINETLNLTQNSPVTRLDKIDTEFNDHSGAHFHLYADKDEIKLSIRLPAWREISQKAELLDSLTKSSALKSLWQEQPDEGYNATIACKIENLTKEVIDSFSNLKQKILAAPLSFLLEKKTSGEEQTFTVPLGNGNEDFYMATSGAKGDQVIVLFAMKFVDQTDTVLARVFLQEFFDVRSKLEDAPAVLLGKEPPKELAQAIKNIKSTSSNNDNTNYLTLVLFPRHYETEAARLHLQKTLPFLPDYLHYHLKCCKAYLHKRMRAKSGDFLKMLNRAKPENF
jgi:actin related protein 2/3 complex, subunit 2